MKSFIAYFGHRYGRGGQMIKEQMIINAATYNQAWNIAESRCYRGEQVLDVVDYVPPEDLAFWRV